jgi:selenocysteine lyase/cysteine desulfurase
MLIQMAREKISGRYDTHRGVLFDFAQSHAPSSSSAGRLVLTYFDNVASGQCVSSFEDFVSNELARTFANTHTEGNIAGASSTHYLHESYDVIRDCFGASKDDVVIQSGTGLTGALTQVFMALGLYASPQTIDTINELVGLALLKKGDKKGVDVSAIMEKLPKAQRHRVPVIIIDTLHHHTPQLLTEASVGIPVEVKRKEGGQQLDMDDLRAKLDQYKDHPRFVLFSAQSNVTGVQPQSYEDIYHAVNDAGGVMMWDMAAMNAHSVPAQFEETGMDGPSLKTGDVLLNATHKNLGGPGSPGVAVAKASVLETKMPPIPGGGTVVAVSPKGAHFAGGDARYQPGTQGPKQSVVGALSMDLIRQIGTKKIHDIEAGYMRDFEGFLGEHSDKFQVLGDLSERHGPIYSILVKDSGAEGKLLHSSYVMKLLNAFKIMVRSGCFCAGVNLHHLLGIDEAKSDELLDRVLRGYELDKPGAVRIGLKFSDTPEDLDFLKQALLLVHEHGPTLMSQFEFYDDGRIESKSDVKPDVPLSAVGAFIRDALTEGGYDYDRLEATDSVTREELRVQNHREALELFRAWANEVRATPSEQTTDWVDREFYRVPLDHHHRLRRESRREDFAETKLSCAFPRPEPEDGRVGDEPARGDDGPSSGGARGLGRFGRHLARVGPVRQGPRGGRTAEDGTGGDGNGRSCVLQ